MKCKNTAKCLHIISPDLFITFNSNNQSDSCFDFDGKYKLGRGTYIRVSFEFFEQTRVFVEACEGFRQATRQGHDRL